MKLRTYLNGWLLSCGHLVAVIQIRLLFSSVMESRDGRAAIESALQRLRLDLPALPQLRDFQVAEASLIYDSSCSHCLIVDGHLRMRPERVQ